MGGIVIFAAIMIILFSSIAIFGEKWGKEWVATGVMTEQDRMELGYLGCFLGKIFGL